MSQRQLSGRERYYVNSTSFEVYMIVGLVWLVLFSLAFILSVALNMEVWLWPGALLSVVIAAGVLFVLSRRERAAKLRELDTSE